MLVLPVMIIGIITKQLKCFIFLHDIIPPMITCAYCACMQRSTVRSSERCSVRCCDIHTCQYPPPHCLHGIRSIIHPILELSSNVCRLLIIQSTRSKIIILNANYPNIPLGLKGARGNARTSPGWASRWGLLARTSLHGSGLLRHTETHDGSELRTVERTVLRASYCKSCRR